MYLGITSTVFKQYTIGKIETFSVLNRSIKLNGECNHYKQSIYSLTIRGNAFNLDFMKMPSSVASRYAGP